MREKEGGREEREGQRRPERNQGKRKETKRGKSKHVQMGCRKDGKKKRKEKARKKGAAARPSSCFIIFSELVKYLLSVTMLCRKNQLGS